MKTISELQDLYTSLMGFPCLGIIPLPQAGSSRKYFRLESPQAPPIIGTIGTCVEENEAFIYLSNHFTGKNLPVPRVLAVSPDRKCYLQTDAGDLLLFNIITRYNNKQIPLSQLYEALTPTVEKLAEMQFKGAQGLDFSKCYPVEEFDRRSIFWDLNYFKYCFLKSRGIEPDESRLEDDFEQLASTLLSYRETTFMLRDFQSRNVMIQNGEPVFIDFQGGRRGPFYYDLASFLWQARANFNNEIRQHLIKVYKDKISQYIRIDDTTFNTALRYFALFRTLQVLGAYGYRGLIQKKDHFISSIPFALKNLRELVTEPFAELPYLNSILTALANQAPDIAGNQQKAADDEQQSHLWIDICSFSYKKGIPEDTSGNGGGFVFDCRAVENPGRYEQYKTLTGRDEAVKTFIMNRTEMPMFMQNIFAIVEPSVETYIRRQFTHLSVAFGCTGGQHRSVYGADALARHLHDKYNVGVRITHREQGITETLYPK